MPCISLVLEFARQSGPSLLIPPPSLSLSLSLHKLQILNWLGQDLVQSAVCYRKGVHRAVHAVDTDTEWTCNVQVFVTTLVLDLLYSELF